MAKKYFQLRMCKYCGDQKMVDLEGACRDCVSESKLPYAGSRVRSSQVHVLYEMYANERNGKLTADAATAARDRFGVVFPIVLLHQNTGHYHLVVRKVNFKKSFVLHMEFWIEGWVSRAQGDHHDH